HLLQHVAGGFAFGGCFLAVGWTCGEEREENDRQSAAERHPRIIVDLPSGPRCDDRSATCAAAGSARRRPACRSFSRSTPAPAASAAATRRRQAPLPFPPSSSAESCSGPGA